MFVEILLVSLVLHVAVVDALHVAEETNRNWHHLRRIESCTDAIQCQ